MQKAIGKWAMVDVFTISYGIFSIISDQIIPGCVVLNGYWFCLAYLGLNYTLDILTAVYIDRVLGVAMGDIPENSSFLDPASASYRHPSQTTSEIITPERVNYTELKTTGELYQGGEQ